MCRFEEIRCFLFPLMILSMLTSAAFCRAAAEKPRLVGKTHQLFIEDELIESYDGLARIINQPVKHQDNPVLTYTEPWEGNCVIAWGSVLYEPDEKLFKIWYQVYKKVVPDGESPSLICYATSRDGLNWEKPELGLVEFRGSTANNIIMAGDLDSPTVFRDPHPTPQSKYLMYWFGYGKRGVRAARSADGIHWQQFGDILIKPGDRTIAGYDASRQKFYIITKIPGRGPFTCTLWESDDGEHFEYVKEIAAPDDRDLPKTEFYGMISFPYAGLRLGFLELWYVPTRKLNTQLMYSRDGLDWHRAADRQVFLQWGPPGSWDRTWVTPTHNPPIRVGDKLYIFYQGRQTMHWCEPPFGHIASIGLAMLSVDGFVSLEFIEPTERKPHRHEGTATTAPLLLDGETLHINAFARPGTVQVEILDLDGKAISGFTRNNCLGMTNIDSVDQEVKWREGRKISSLAGKPVRLRFYVQAAKLYSFWVE